MTIKKVLLRVDGDSEIGLGHLYRGIALSKMLVLHYKIVFVLKESSNADPVLNSGFEVSILPENVSLLNEPLYLKQYYGDFDIVVMDGYGFNALYQLEVKESGFITVFVDDLVSGVQKSDLVLNHCPGITENDYLKEDYTQFALGLNYALLRPNFTKIEKDSIKIKKELKTIFIMFGGADPYDFSLKTVESLLRLTEIDQIRVVLGGSYIHEEIFRLSDKRISFHRNLSESEIFKLMKDSDLAITAASTTSIELAALGIPMILGYFIDNQIRIYKGFVNNSAVIGIGDLNDFSFDKLVDLIESNKKNIGLIQASLLSLFNGDIETNTINKFESLC